MGDNATCLDLDDFSIGNAHLDLLDTLKQAIPDLKVTLFTVPLPFDKPYSLSQSLEFIRTVKIDRPWVEFALHGWQHTRLECQAWTLEQTQRVLLTIEHTGLFVHGFKAPYWELCPAVYHAVNRQGWWIADHERNQQMRPPGTRVYLLDRPERVHGHVQDIGSNGLKEAWATYVALRGPFKFVSEIMAAEVVR